MAMAAFSLCPETKMHNYRLDMQMQWCTVFLSIMIIVDDYTTVLGCLEDEKIGLLKLKDVIKHHNRSVPLSWSTDDEPEPDCCKWEGVTCDDMFSKRIINLSLNLAGILEDSQIYDDWFLDAFLFQPFQELQNLTIANGWMQGVKGPSRLTKLKVLDLNYNYVISHIPFMGELPSLKILDLSGNNLTHAFQELTNLSSLELLNLDYNYIEGKIPSSISALTSLKMLGLSKNLINGSLPEGLCALTNLEELDLSLNELEGVIPACLSKLTSLRVLDLSRNNFSGSIPSNLFSSLKSLEYVDLSGNFFDGLVSFSSFADNSKLEVFKLENKKPKLKVETENAQWKPPFFQLKVLRLSNCIVNEPTGAIPSFLLSQSDLRVVDLSNNGMSGVLPSWLLTNNSRLESLILRDNSFTGELVVKLDAYNAYMDWLDVSMNKLIGQIPTFIGSVLPNLSYWDMSRNAIEGTIPSSIENMIKLFSLDLSNNNLSGEIPENLINGCEELVYLKLSNNMLGGNILPKKNPKKLSKLKSLYLDSNNFSGDLTQEILPLALGSLRLLDISNNSISGRFPDWIAELTDLKSLDLSRNQFEGELHASFCNLTVELIFLDLSWNNFGDFLPPCSNLSSLKNLHLQGNGFHGPLPTSLNRSSNIVTLDVRDNMFSGLIPAWIGSLSSLTNLLLKGNIFHGSLPLELCQLKNLNILDLAANNLSGPVPPCLSHIPFGKTEYVDWENAANILQGWRYFGSTSEYSYENKLHVGEDVTRFYEASNIQEELQFTTKNMSEIYKGSILNFLSGIDLSLNKFTGHIPLDFGEMDMIYSLNLSNNHFNGTIPSTLSGLKKLESLDLSHNMLSGKIPSDIIKLTSLSTFSVAYNNLSGPTPTRTNQFGTFAASSYDGNPLLCGLPLDRSCTGGSMLPYAKPATEPKQNDTSFKIPFLWSFFGSFVGSCIGSFLFFYFGTNVPQIFLGWLGAEKKVPSRRTIELV